MTEKPAPDDLSPEGLPPEAALASDAADVAPPVAEDLGADEPLSVEANANLTDRQEKSVEDVAHPDDHRQERAPSEWRIPAPALEERGSWSGSIEPRSGWWNGRLRW